MFKLWGRALCEVSHNQWVLVWIAGSELRASGIALIVLLI